MIKNVPVPFFQVTDLSVAVAGRQLLANVNLTLNAAERVALVGPSGCGKTTLLRCLVGLADAVGGDVRFEDRSPEQIGHPAFRRRVLLVDQQPAMLDATVEQNLRRPFAYHTAGGAAFSRSRAVDLLVRVGLDETCMTQDARSLSVGEQQRVSLVRAMLIEPCVLLLDEPTSALDEQSRDQVEKLVRETTEAGAAALIVLHDRERAEQWCHRAIDLGAMMVGGTDS